MAANPDTGVDLALVPRIRIDFRLLPVNGRTYYSKGMMTDMISHTVEEVIGYCPPENDIHIQQSIPPVSWGWEEDRYLKEQQQLKYGDPGFLFIRDLSFLDNIKGENWENKFCKARRFVLKQLHLSVYVDASVGCSKQQVLTYLKPSEDAYQMIYLISRSAEEAPRIVLKGVPCEWFADKPSMQTLRNFLDSLGKVRDLDTSENSVLIQFVDREECCKALKKLCSCSLKKDGDSRMVDYEVILKDSVSDVSQEVLPDEEQCGSLIGLSLEQDPFVPTNQNISKDDLQALRLRMNMLEEELKGVKALLGASSSASTYV